MKDADNLEDDLPAPAGTSKLVIILLALNLVAGGLAAFKAMTAQAAPAVAAPVEGPTDVPGPLHSFQPFVVNLNNPENARFLKVTVDAELKNEKVLEKLDDSHVRIARDGVMRYLSSLTMEQVMGEQAKDVIATEIVSRLNTALGEGLVKRVLFAEFVVQ